MSTDPQTVEIEAVGGSQTRQDSLAAATLWVWGWARKGVIWAVLAGRRWQVGAALPGLLGAAMVACGVGGLVGAAFGPAFGPWAGVLAGGVFLLRIDSRIGGG